MSVNGSTGSSRKRSRTSTSLDEIFDNDQLLGSIDDTGKISKSCDLCKLKKIKCDGAKPYCSFCRKNGQESCHYSIMKKPGLKAGYGKGMTQRMDILEAELKALKSEVSSVKHLTTKLRDSENSRSTIGTDSTVDTSSSKSGQMPLSINPESNKELNINKDSNYFGLPSSAQCSLLLDLFFRNINSIFPLLHPSSKLVELESAIKNRNQGTKPPLLLHAVILVTLKFLNNDQLDEDSKLRYYEYCKDQIISTSLRKINIESLQSMILLAYDSLSGSVKVPESWNYVSIAADYANYLKLGNEKTNKLSIVTGDSPSSVTSSSLNPAETNVRRKSKSINNRSINLLKRPKSWIDEESRRHCFWCIFILDKLYAISSSHDLKLKSSKISCYLPVKLSYWLSGSGSEIKNELINQPKTLRTNEPVVSPGNESINSTEIEAAYDSFAYYIELNNIMGDIHSFSIEEFDIYQIVEVEQWKSTFMRLDNQMNRWRRSLPLSYQKFLKNGNFTDTQNMGLFDILLFVFYRTTVVKLHSSAGYPHGESDLFKPSEDSRAHCLEAADEVYTFVSHLSQVTNDDDIFEKLGPHFGFFIWINCRILFVDIVYKSHSINYQLGDYQKKLSFFANVLKKIGKFWESSMVYYKILEFLNVSDLSYVNKFSASPAASSEKKNSISFSDIHGAEDEDSSDDQEITDEKREPTKIVTDMRLGSHSLVYWFNKLAGKTSNSTSQLQHHFNKPPISGNLSSNSLANFQTSSMQGFEEFQISHDDFFNFLALDVNGSGFQDMNL